MRAIICCIALAVGLSSSVAFAQDGLRSASLPETSLTPRPPTSTEGRDVFRARPGTYRPNRNRIPYPLVYGYLEPPIYPDPQVVVVQIPQQAVQPERAAPALTPYIPGPPGPQKTFYVIPGCYAGDRRPEPRLLPPTCDIGQLLVIPPS